MLTILLSLVAGAVVGGLFRVTNLVHTIPGAITPAVLATIVAVVLLMRRAGKKINPVVEEAQRHLQGGRRELALKSLRAGLAYRHWHPLLEGQLRTQIGALLYASNDIDGAITELERASKRPWEAPAFLGCAHFKKRNEDAMVKAFEKAIKSGAKDGLAYTVYAYCLAARGKKDEAVKILEKGVAKLPTDARLKANLELVQTGKKMKVAPYGDRWAAFGLDGSVPGVPKAARGFAQRPGFRQKPIRR
jgi:tetratricopeptide (TPR) repeat protein